MTEMINMENDHVFGTIILRSKTCTNCKHKYVSFRDEPCNECEQFNKFKEEV